MSARGVQTISSSNVDELAKVFNSALLATRKPSDRDIAAEVLELVQSSAYRAILMAVRQLAVLEGISERQAAEQLAKTFRKMDNLWGDYVFAEGLDRVRGKC
jgi:hypothetical protein